MTKVRLLSVTLAGLLLVVQAGSVLAQTPEPIERTPEMEEHAAAFAALFPETIGGASLLENLDISVGQEVIGELDPSQPDQADEIARFHEMVEAAGATLDDAATASTYAQVSEDSWAMVLAFQIRDADVQPALPILVATFEGDIPDVVVEEGRVGDQEMTFLSSAEDPEAGAIAILARGDVIWMLSVPTELLEETVGALPEAASAD